MGTISQKALYLNETKKRIKNRINLIGGDLDDTNTFREYAEELDSIYDDMPKVEGEGSNFTINQTRKGGLEVTPKGKCEQEVIAAVAGTTVEGSNLTVNDFDTTKEMTITPLGNCEQDTYTGKNLMPLTTQDFTINNVRYYVENGSLYLNGTSTGETNTNNTNFKNNFSFTLSAGNYTVTRNHNVIRTPFRIYKKEDDTVLLLVDAIHAGGTFTLEEETECYFGIYVYNQVYNNVNSELMIRLSSITDATYEPYVRGNT